MNGDDADLGDTRGDDEDFTVPDEATEASAPASIRRSGIRSIPTIESVDSEGLTADISLRVTGAGGSLGLGSAPSAHDGTTAASPLDALLLEEITRTRAFLAIVVVICVAMLGAIPLLSGDPVLEIVLAGAMVMAIGGSLWLRRTIRNPMRFSVRTVMPVGWWIAVTTCIGVMYWGVFSPGPCLIVMGVYFFSRAQSFVSALIIYATCAATQLVVSGLVLSKAVSDPGIIVAGDIPLLDLVLAQAVTQMVFLATFVLARASRKATLEGIAQLEREIRRVSQRDALIQEVRQDLDRALKLGGAGRYTEQILDSYKLGVVIGRGAMGEVYEAVHTETGELAAVKLLHPNVLSNPDLVHRFLREAEVTGALQLPNVVRILTASDRFAPIPYLIMERLRGNDLAHHLREKRRLPAEAVVRLIRHVGRVVDAAREKGIVHRDLKPQNLFLAEQSRGKPVWKVLDFGVSKLGDSTGTLTKGSAIGTPTYMAPEQARGQDVDYRADIYALGAIAYRCLTGRPPFGGPDVPSILLAVVSDVPPRPSEFANLSTDYDHVLAIGLAKRRADRFQTAVELVDALESARIGELSEEIRRRGAALQAEQAWKHTAAKLD